MARDAARILLGEIVAVHGIRGLVKVRTFTETPEDITAYGGLTDQAGRPVELSLRGRTKGGVLAAVAGVHDRNGAEALRGTGLYVDRAALPPVEADDEYYQADLIGLEARLEDGRRLGEVRAVQDFGAGTMLEIELAEEGRSVLLPFTREAVPELALDQGFLIVVPDPGLLD